MDMCDGMAFVMHEMPRKIKYLIGGHLNELSESEMISLSRYAKAHLDTHGFVNNIPVPPEWKKIRFRLCHRRITIWSER